MKVLYFMLGWSIGALFTRVLFSSEISHQCPPSYKEAYFNCMKDREKVREILKGDSLHTLLYW